MKRKLCPSITAALLLMIPAACFLCRIPVSAGDYPPDTTVFSCGNVSGLPGETVMVSVNVPQNTGFNAFGLRVYVPRELKPVMQENGEDFKRKKGEVAEDILLSYSYQEDTSIVGFGAIAPDRCSLTGNLINFWVEIPADAEPNTVYEIRPEIDTCTEMYGEEGNMDSRDVPCFMENGSITVADPDLKGDLNRDGKINIPDAVLLNRLLAEELPEPLRPTEEYDINGDDLLTMADLRVLLSSITSG